MDSAANLQARNAIGRPAFGFMVKQLKSQSTEAVLPLFLILSAILAVVGCFSLLLFYFSQPTIYPNPGLAAYAPPPGTRLLPLLRMSNAPELVNLPDEPPSPLWRKRKIQRCPRALLADALAWSAMTMAVGRRTMVSSGILDMAIGAAIVLGAALAKSAVVPSPRSSVSGERRLIP